MTTRAATVLALLVASLAVSAAPLHAQVFSTDVEMLSFDEDGRMSSTSAARLAQLTAGPPPTDVFILAHGWNNSFNDAQASYREMLHKMQDVAARYSLLGRDYRSLVIGVSWPSKAFDDSSSGRALATSGDSDVLALYRAFPVSKAANRDYDSDIQTMEELLAAPPESLTESDYNTVAELFSAYRIVSSNGSGRALADDDAFFQLGQTGRGLFNARLPIPKALRLFTYWQMKERAGIVGETGVRQMVAGLQNAFGASKIHLIGHSFGCKLALSCVAAAPTLPRKLDTLILLQGAVSYQAMSPIGGYAQVPARVSGPVIVTFSDNDSALGVPYELASRVAGQTAEQRSISPYAALGRVGAEFAAGTSVVPATAEDAYHFAGGDTYNVFGGAFISGHSDFTNEAVARMAWAGVQSANTGGRRVGGRSINADETAAAASVAAKVVKELPADASEERLLRLYADSVEANLRTQVAPQEHTFALKNIGLSNNGRAMSLDSLAPDERESVNMRRLLNSSIIDERFLTIPSFRKSVRQWIVNEGGTSAVGRIVAPGSCDQSHDTDYPQCVAVCWKPKQPATARYKLFGSGTLIEWNVVLTAGHVVPAGLETLSATERAAELTKYQFGVCIGAEGPDRNGELPTGSVIIPVSARIEHPEFSGRPLKNDLALLKLEKAATSKQVFGQDNVELEFKLATTNVWAADAPKQVALVGFGFCDREATTGAGFRRAAKNVLAAIPESEEQARMIGCVFDREFAAGGQGIDTCNGDSGGPVFAVVNGKAWCVGTTSRPTAARVVGGLFGGDRGQVSSCGDGGIYSLHFKQTWLQQAIANLRAQP